MGQATSVQLRTRFASSALHHARKALEGYREASHPDFYLHAGTALELAIKARLVGDHGVYCIAPDARGWFKATLRLARDVDGAQGERPHTVEAAEALRRLQLLEPELPEVFGRHVAGTLERRNVGAHAGHGSAPSDEEFLSHVASFVTAVGVLLKTEPASFWGDLAGVAASLVDQELDAVRVRVQVKIAKARAAVRQVGPDALGVLDAKGLADLEDEEPDVVAVTCPACGQHGWATGRVADEGEAESEYEDGAIEWHWMPELVLLVDFFVCPVCSLTLVGQETSQAGIPSKVPNDRASPADAYDAVTANEAYYLS